jgi:rhodanese-related sulfurtransferase
MSVTLAQMIADARAVIAEITPAELKDMGYEDVEVLAGSVVAWAEAGLPVEGAAEPSA